ncbi:MAG: HNH/ENDO VII family nuclease [Lachnospiraceae bacterium]|nr:HNH/ENDO VII family nuclease [Lachnospiraceae bacterium]
MPSSSDHYLNRPYIRQETIDAVNAKTKVNYKTGQIYDSITKKWVDPSDVELGHTKGNEFAYYRDWAESQGWTQSQFNDFMNNPDFYAWQDVYSNRSHKFEAKH